MTFLESASPVSLRSITSPRRMLIGALILLAGPVMALGQLSFSSV